MMKRTISLLLVIVLSLSLMACGTKNDKVGTKEPTKQDQNQKEDEQTNSNPLSDERVRQAINYAIDMEAVIDSLMDGKAIAANSFTPNGEWKTEGLIDYNYDPDKARELLKEADWDKNYELDVVYYYGDQLTVDLMTAIQAYLADVGMKMNFRKLEGDLASQLWVAPEDSLNGPSEVEWDMAYAGIAALGLNEYYNRMRSGFPSNSHTPKDEKLDKLIDFVNSTADVDEQKQGFAEMQKYINEKLVNIPLYYQQVFVAESDNVIRGNETYGNEQFNYDWNIVNWDVKREEDGKKVLLTNGGPVEFFETPFFNPGFFMSTKVLYDHLIVADENLSPKKGQLASEYNVSEDSLTVDFTLKDGIKWHDGEDITAEDVKWTYEYAAKVTALNSVFASTLKALEGYQEYADGNADEISGIVIDGNKITFKFAKVEPNMLLTFTQLPPLPRKYFENIDPLKVQQAKYWQNPVGSGPFKIKEVAMNNYATFVPFEQYHDGVAKIDEIRMYPSGESDLNLVRNAAAGQLDYAYTKSVQDVKSLEKMDNMKVVPVDIRYTRIFYVNKFPKK